MKVKVARLGVVTNRTNTSTSFGNDGPSPTIHKPNTAAPIEPTCHFTLLVKLTYPPGSNCKTKVILHFNATTSSQC